MLCDLLPHLSYDRQAKLTAPWLPVTLYRHIIEAIGSQRDLIKLLSASEAFHAESERLLYLDITIKDKTIKDSIRLLNCLSEFPRIALHVRKFSITIPLLKGDRHPENAEEYFCAVNKALCALHRLEHLHLDNLIYCFRARSSAWLRPSFSLLTGCTFQLKSLSMCGVYDFDRPALEKQKRIEQMSIHYAHSNSLSQIPFPHLSTLTFITSESSLDHDSIKGIKALRIDGFSMKTSAAIRSPLVNITSLILWNYDPSMVVDIPHLFPYIRYLGLHISEPKLSLTVLEGCIEHLQNLHELRKVYFAWWTEKELPTQPIVSRWFSKMINVESITIEFLPMREFEWVRGAEQWVKVTANVLEEWRESRWIV